jgi:branched-chain amino acid transport system permease protein
MVKLWQMFGLFRRRQIMAVSLIMLLLVLFPFANPSYYILHIVTIAFVYSVLASSWDLLGGYTGYVTLAHAAFFGIGAYISAILAGQFFLSPWIVLIIAGLFSALVGLIIFLPLLRLSGIYFALATLAFSEILRILLNTDFLAPWTRGAQGLYDYPTFPGIPYTPFHYYFLGLIFFVASTIIIIKLKKSNFGLILQAIREDSDRAEGIGINVVRYKIMCFSASCFFAGLAGSFYAYYINVITPNLILPEFAILIVAMSIIGGRGTLLGPIMGAFLVEFLYEIPRVFGFLLHQILIGVAMIAIILLFPNGLNALLKTIQKYFTSTKA